MSYSLGADLASLWEDIDDAQSVDQANEQAADARSDLQTVFDNCRCGKASAKAYLIEFADGKTRWVPISQIRGGSITGAGTKGRLVVSEWMAEQWEAESPKETAAMAVELRAEATVEVKDCLCLKESDKAIYIQTPDEKEFWVPRSQCRPGNEVEHDGDLGTLKITKWLAAQKGIGG